MPPVVAVASAIVSVVSGIASVATTVIGAVGSAIGSAAGALAGAAKTGLGFAGKALLGAGKLAMAHPGWTGAIVGGAGSGIQDYQETGKFNPMAVAKGAALGGAIGGGIGQFATGWNAAGNAGMTSFGQKASAGFRQLATGSWQPGASGEYSSLSTPANAVGRTPAGYTGSINAGGTTMSYGGASAPAGAGARNLAGGWNTGSGFQSVNAAGSASSGPSLFGGIIGTNKSRFSTSNLSESSGAALGIQDVGKLAAGGLASAVYPKPELPYGEMVKGTLNDYSTTKTYLGETSLPAATRAELDYFINTPLSEIGSERFNYDTEGEIRKITESFDDQAAQLKRKYAQLNQNQWNSSDLQNQLREVEQDRAQTLSDYRAEKNNRVKSMAYEAKQWAFQQELLNNEYNNNLAMELAKVANLDKELEYAIATQNYEDFQKIIQQMLTIGYA